MLWIILAAYLVLVSALVGGTVIYFNWSRRRSVRELRQKLGLPPLA
jgi:hypothetical protein